MINFIIPGELCDLNHFIAANNANRYKAALIKKAETYRVASEIRAAKVPKITSPMVEMICTWYTKDRKKDSDNIMFATKFLMDGMVMAKILPNDTRAYTGSFVHHFETDRLRPRVEIEISV